MKLLVSKPYPVTILTVEFWGFLYLNRTIFLILTVEYETSSI